MVIRRELGRQDRERLAWQAVEAVKDPEIPVLSIVDLGIVRALEVRGDRVRVVLTPTFSGCPALDVILREVEESLGSKGFSEVEVELSLSPPWSSDMMTERGRRQLQGFGLSPPPLHGGNLMLALDQSAKCPYCGSEQTERKNDFGSTLCRSIHYCNSCQQPFEAFKPL